jgi:dCTP deaminase
MILTDREIISAISNKQISITPPPSPTAYSSTSVDLMLARQIRLWNQIVRGTEVTVCPGDPSYSYERVAKAYTTPIEIPNEGYTLEPGHFLLGWTIENVDFPCHSRICARVEGKSSLARLGISIHQTAPIIHAGFKGPIQLEISHNGVLPVKLIVGMPICQLILEQTFGTPDKGYKGQFYEQSVG